VRAHCVTSATLSQRLCVSSHVLPYLNLQEVIATNALVVHLMVSIVSITAALVFNKGEAVEVVSN
jgi:hypothetical protein